MTILQDIISALQVNTSSFKSYVNINSISVSTVLKRYNLKTTLHTSVQHVNSLTAVTAIQRKHDIMRNEKYSMTAYDAAIVYFETLMKHLNAEEKINITEMMLLDSYFNE